MSSTQPASSIPLPLAIKQPPRSSPISLTSHEINILIAEYLAESNLLHSAFAFRLESKLPTTTPAELHGLKVERGALIRWLHKGLCWSEVESHVTELGHKPPCSAPFTLLKPHKCVAYLPPTAFPSPSPPPPSPSRSVLAGEGSTEASSSKLPENSITEEKVRDQIQTDANATDKPQVRQEQGKEREKGKEKEKHKEKGKERERDGEATSGNGKSKRKASLSTAKLGSEENGKSMVSSSSSNGGSGGGGSGGSKRARVESPPESNESSVSNKKAPGHPPLPSFSRKTTSNGSNMNSKTSTTLKTGSKPSSPSANTVSLPSVPTSSSKSTKTASPETAPTRPQSADSLSPLVTAPISNSVTKKKRPVTNAATTADLSSKIVEDSKRPSTINRSGGKSGEIEGLIYGTDYTLAKNLKEVPVCKEGEIASFKSHTGEVFVCAFGIREGILATGAGDASVRLWEFTPPSGLTTAWSVKEPPIICKHLPATDKKDITSIEFNPSGTLIGTASYDGIARIWTPEGELHGVLTRHSGPVFSLKFNPKGSLIATAGSDGSVCVWDAVTARLKQCYEFHSDCALDVDWFDDDTLASASKDKTIQICKVGSTIPFRTFKGHTDEINRVQWSPLVSIPDGSTSGSKAGTTRHRRQRRRVLASCSDDATVRIWSLDGEDKPSFGLSSDDSSSTSNASPSTSGSATTSNTNSMMNSNLHMTNTTTTSSSAAVSSFLMTGGGGGERCCLGVLRGHSKEIYSFAWSPLPYEGSETNSGTEAEVETEERLVLATGSFDETIRIWDIQTMSCRWVLRAHTQTVFSLSFSCTGRYLASAGWDGLVVIWDTETGKAIRHHKVPNEVGVYEIEWSKHGKVIAICQADKVVSLIGVNDLE
ncbi:Beta-transducin family (WD-40 repeat) protein [Phaffia rhodozyma]|uniref:Beta-transducin family (WD-40 repeat) protein n=1 Tax=Phaffia rhodozyma TaxID=264483 RepID=A0A0F7SVP6_PHARH|nr:Beta-transducin family (WD-40 repeat) protein [Phaffia rhodozyma]